MPVAAVARGRGSPGSRAIRPAPVSERLQVSLPAADLPFRQLGQHRWQTLGVLLALAPPDCRGTLLIEGLAPPLLLKPRAFFVDAAGKLQHLDIALHLPNGYLALEIGDVDLGRECPPDRRGDRCKARRPAAAAASAVAVTRLATVPVAAATV